ncbi:MAG TPA: nicotinate-nucleotide adenylyltransferase [Candidatus Angelobacter sp.]|nr:nicotinate-nucleotide adenylyltransferase [Candidatus Angelobacter sp.]
MKLALYGGTFDPVHRGHLAIARAAAQRFDLSLIYFVPADLPPHKGNRALTDFHHRYAMLVLATADDDRLIPSLLEANSSQPNYSIQTVRRLKSTLKKADKLFFLIGIDAFMEISTWKQPVQLLGECDFIVASRPGYSLGDVGDALPEGLRPSKTVLQALRRQQASGTIALPSTTIHLLPEVNERVSSTQIRGAADKSLKQLSQFVPEPVAAYIKKQHLYTASSEQEEKGSARDGKVLSFRRAHQQE